MSAVPQPHPAHSILGIGYELMLRASETVGTYELMKFVVPPGAGPPPHKHTREDECFYLVDGALTVTRGDECFRTVAGDVLHMPRIVPHGFRNESSDWATFLCWVTPATLEGFFAGFQREWPADSDALGPPTPEDIQAMLASAEQHGIEILMS